MSWDRLVGSVTAPFRWLGVLIAIGLLSGGDDDHAKRPPAGHRQAPAQHHKAPGELAGPAHRRAHQRPGSGDH